MPAEIADKAAKLIRLLGSNHDGEVVAAARGLVRILDAHGYNLNDFADSAGSTLERPRLERTTDSDMLDAVKNCFSSLSDKEAAFVAGIDDWISQGRELTAKQRKWLNDIHDRLMEDA